MRRIDVIGIAAALLGIGALVFGLEQSWGKGLPWGQLSLFVLIVVWVGSYVRRFLTKSMTYHQQLEDYRIAVLKQRWEELTPEEREALEQQAEE
ncbi:MAG: DUF3007 family protein [Oscillatoriales cyanobacterium SM2_2_1]|nr:DUF3007 family protein [Oscillatoriales cyanobacterium SM2_2_1]